MKTIELICAYKKCGKVFQGKYAYIMGKKKWGQKDFYCTATCGTKAMRYKKKDMWDIE